MYKQMAGVIVLSCACATATAGYGFEPIAALAPDVAWAHAVAIGDVTGDGRDDVVVLGGGSHEFYRNRVILYAQVPGGFAPPVAIDYHPDPINNDATGTAIGLADLDADADLDIIVSHGSNPSASLAVLRNDGVGFTAATFPSEESLHTIKFMDVGGDGHLDLVGRDIYGDIAIFPGNGAAAFGEATWLPYSASALHLVDMDGDGKKDLVYLYRSWEKVFVHRNEGAGFSPTPRTLLTLGAGDIYGRLAVADFDGDDRADLVVSFDSGPRHTILFYPQGSDGRFRRKLLVGAARGNVNSLQAGDLDGDGRQDLLLLDQSFDAKLSVRLARAHGGFSAAAYEVGSTSGVTPGDLNDDGIMDMVLSGGDGGISYMLGRASSTEADLAVFLGLNAGDAVVRVENQGAEFSIGGYGLSLSVEPRIGSVGVGSLPSDCSAYTAPNGSLQAICQMPALAPGAHHERTFPFAITASTQRVLLFGRARVSPSSWPEPRRDNNEATKRINVVVPAD